MKKLSRKLVLLLSLVAVLAITVGSTLAYLQATTGILTNTFKFADVRTEIEEKLGDTKQIYIQNNGDSSAYVRVRLSLSGLTAEQMENVRVVHDANPNVETYKGEDYITILTYGQWAQENAKPTPFKPDDFFYYAGELGSQKQTDKPLEVVVGSGADVDADQNFEVIVYHESVLASTSGLTEPSDIASQF